MPVIIELGRSIRENTIGWYLIIRELNDCCLFTSDTVKHRIFWNNFFGDKIGGALPRELVLQVRRWNWIITESQNTLCNSIDVFLNLLGYRHKFTDFLREELSNVDPVNLWEDYVID